MHKCHVTSDSPLRPFLHLKSESKFRHGQLLCFDLTEGLWTKQPLAFSWMILPASPYPVNDISRAKCCQHFLAPRFWTSSPRSKSRCQDHGADSRPEQVNSCTISNWIIIELNYGPIMDLQLTGLNVCWRDISIIDSMLASHLAH